MTRTQTLCILTYVGLCVIGICLSPGCGNMIAPTTQPIFGTDSVHITIIVEKVDVPVSAPISATANITVNGHAFSATAPATQPGRKP
jgi:hypothetical protein